MPSPIKVDKGMNSYFSPSTPRPSPVKGEGVRRLVFMPVSYDTACQPINGEGSCMDRTGCFRAAEEAWRFGFKAGLERERGFEPPTPSLARKCSTTELLPLGRVMRGQNMVPRVRIELTTPSIFSAVLYQLSYLGE